MDKEPTNTKMRMFAFSTKDFGSKELSKPIQEKNPLSPLEKGQIIFLSISENLIMEKLLDLVLKNGRMERFTEDNFLRAKCMEMELSFIILKALNSRTRITKVSFI